MPSCLNENGLKGACSGCGWGGSVVAAHGPGLPIPDGQTTDSRRNMRSPGSNMPTGTALHEFYGGTEIGIITAIEHRAQPEHAPA